MRMHGSEASGTEQDVRGWWRQRTMSQRVWYRCAIRSQCSCGVTPAAAADAAIFSPCSSVPVTNVTALPRRRWKRAATSAAIVEYAPPMCGSALPPRASVAAGPTAGPQLRCERAHCPPGAVAATRAGMGGRACFSGIRVTHW